MSAAVQAPLNASGLMVGSAATSMGLKPQRLHNQAPFIITFAL